MAAARHRLSPSGQFLDSSDAGPPSAYVVQNDSDINGGAVPLELAAFTVPLAAGGDYWISWQVETEAQGSTDNTEPVGVLSLELNAAVQCAANVPMLISDFVWQNGGLVSRALEPGDIVTLVWTPVLTAESGATLRRRRLVLMPITIATP